MQLPTLPSQVHVSSKMSNVFINNFWKAQRAWKCVHCEFLLIPEGVNCGCECVYSKWCVGGFITEVAMKVIIQRYGSQPPPPPPPPIQSNESSKNVLTLKKISSKLNTTIAEFYQHFTIETICYCLIMQKIQRLYDSTVNFPPMGGGGGGAKNFFAHFAWFLFSPSHP